MKKSRKQILEAIRQLLKNSSPDAKVILFGSQARNDAKTNSDWDILILLNKQKIDSSDFDKISYPLYELGWSMGENFSSKIYTISDWQKRQFTPFYKNVENEGILL